MYLTVQLIPMETESSNSDTDQAVSICILYILSFLELISTNSRFIINFHYQLPHVQHIPIETETYK